MKAPSPCLLTTSHLRVLTTGFAEELVHALRLNVDGLRHSEILLPFFIKNYNRFIQIFI